MLEEVPQLLCHRFRGQIMKAVELLLKQHFYVLTLVLGFILFFFSLMTVGKSFAVSTHPLWREFAWAGGLLICFSLAAYIYTTVWPVPEVPSLDVTSKVKKVDGGFCIVSNQCEITVLEGRIEDQPLRSDRVTVLPCNEYFDDKCAFDSKSSLGAFLGRVFPTRVEDFVILAKLEARRRLGPGVLSQKTKDDFGESFGAGHCILLTAPLGTQNPVALLSTTTQKPGVHSAQVSCVFSGIHDLCEQLVDARKREILMPILGGGLGGIKPDLAFFGLILALAESTKHGAGAHQLEKVTIVIFKKSPYDLPEVAPDVIQRALALVGD